MVNLQGVILRILRILSMIWFDASFEIGFSVSPTGTTSYILVSSVLS